MTMTLSRRQFLLATAAIAAAPLKAHAAADRKFTIALVGGAIGVGGDIRKMMAYAKQYRFESIEPQWHELVKLSESELDTLDAGRRESGLAWAAAGCPVDIRAAEADFDAQMSALPEAAKALQRVGADRIKTWIDPRHSELTYRRNFRLHRDRIRRIAEGVADFGIRFGLEYVGTKTLWTSARYPFIHTMAETRELLDATRQDNVGFVLDTWHWYTAGESEADLLALANKDVVSVDLNDAPEGVAVEAQRDNVRRLPATTGVIDVKTFLNALVQIGYDGPVMAEPFDDALSAMDDAEALRLTSEAMRAAIGTMK